MAESSDFLERRNQRLERERAHPNTAAGDTPASSLIELLDTDVVLDALADRIAERLAVRLYGNAMTQTSPHELCP